MTQTTESKNPIQVADRLFMVLETLSETGSLGLLELSTRLDLHKSTVHRLLTSLIHMGYVMQEAETSKYRLTFKIIDLANNVMSKVDILAICRPYLKQLMEQTGETVHLVQLDGNEAVYIDKVESFQNSIRMVSKVGKYIPLYCSGVGKAIAAEMPLEELKKIWTSTSTKKVTINTIVTFPKFLKELDEVRQKGYALDNEENEIGVRCIAASLPRFEGLPQYAFSLSAPINRMSDQTIEQYSHYILETKRLLMNELYGQ